MVTTLEQAIAQLARLTKADQEQIGRKLLSHVEKLKTLRAEIDKGLPSLDAGEGRTVNIEDLLRKKNSPDGGELISCILVAGSNRTTMRKSLAAWLPTKSSEK
jgi:hypothetical protein